MINCNVEGFRVKTIIRDLQEDVKFWLNNWIDQWPGSGRRPEESGSWSDGSLVFSSWTRCGDVLTRPVTPIITSTTELFHRKLQKTNLLNKNIWKCCHRNYYHFVRVLWCDITIMRKLKPSSHDWRKMSSYGSNHWEGRVEGGGRVVVGVLQLENIRQTFRPVSRPQTSRPQPRSIELYCDREWV